MANEIVLFESQDHEVRLDVQLDGQTVWLTQNQIAELFGKDRTVVTRHINNVFKEGELERKSNVQNLHIPSSDRPIQVYNLDVVISVGYRVKSQRGMDFRRWATNVLRRYIVDGHAENAKRLEQLGQVARIMARIPDNLETRQVLDIVQSYTAALDLLDDYDHQRLTAPKGDDATYVLGYDECRAVIDGMRFGNESALFDRGEKRIDDSTLVAITIMIAESKPEEKQAMVALVMNFLIGGQLK